MPSRNLYLRAPNGELELITPRGPVNPENNVFDKAFNTEVDMDEWDNWMKWEGNANEVDFSESRRESLTSNISSPEAWSTDHEQDLISASYNTANEFPFEDAPFELDESTLSPTVLPLGSIRPLFPAKALPQQDLRRSFRAFSSLTEAEERDLQAIAMPDRMLEAIKIASEPPSPTSSDPYHSPSPSPEPESRTRKANKKRKSSLDDEELPSALCQSRKRGHNAIEKRYRTNLNDKINCLRQGIPSLSRNSSSEAKSDDEGEDSDAEGMDCKTSQQKYGKAAILTRALEYIQHLETTTQRLGSEVDSLKTRVGAFEKLAMSGSIVLNGNSLGAPSLAYIKSETLETIQADFKQIKLKTKPATGAAPRRRSSKQAKIC